MASWEVDLGTVRGDYVTVTRGLVGGEHLVVRGQHLIVAGDHVRQRPFAAVRFGGNSAHAVESISDAALQYIRMVSRKSRG